MLKRGLGGPDDIPINRAHRTKLFFLHLVQRTVVESEGGGGGQLRRFRRGEQMQIKGVFLMLANIMRTSSFKSNS